MKSSPNLLVRSARNLLIRYGPLGRKEQHVHSTHNTDSARKLSLGAKFANSERSLLFLRSPSLCTMYIYILLLPAGPATRMGVKGLNFEMTMATALIHMGYLLPCPLSISSSRTGSPHGSFITKCRTREGYLMAYAEDKNAPKLCPSKMNFSRPVPTLHFSKYSTKRFSFASGQSWNLTLVLLP